MPKDILRSQPEWTVFSTAAVRRSVELRYLPWRSDPNAHVSRIADRFSLTLTRGRRILALIAT
jgi:hypothetical protein